MRYFGVKIFERIPPAHTLRVRGAGGGRAWWGRGAACGGMTYRWRWPTVGALPSTHPPEQVRVSIGGYHFGIVVINHI